MKRIGVAASKIAKDNVMLYNVYVIVIAVLFSSFIFIIAGATVVFALMVLSYFFQEVMPGEYQRNLENVQYVCMVTLTAIVALFNLVAISANIKLTK